MTRSARTALWAGVASAAAVLALLLLSMGGGVGVAAHDRLDRRGRNFAQSLDEEERDRERREHPE